MVGNGAALTAAQASYNRRARLCSRAWVIRMLFLGQLGLIICVYYGPFHLLQGPAPPPAQHYSSLAYHGGSSGSPRLWKRRPPSEGLKEGQGRIDGRIGSFQNLQARILGVTQGYQGQRVASGKEVSGGRSSFRPVDLDASKWLFFVRIQKTGSETLWKNLLQNWDGRVWGRARSCSNGIFCGDHCQGVVESYIDAFEGHGERCRLLVRGHIGVHDFQAAARSRGIASQDVVLFTMLRDPVKRLVSEYIHVTKNLPSQFGPKAYGRAWDYNYTGPADDLTAFLNCQACLVGVSNRQTRLLSGMFPTGAAPALTPQLQEEMLHKAMANLEAMAFVGLTERYADSMLVLRHTFPKQLADFNRYRYSKHPHDGSSSKVEVTPQQRELILKLNDLDLRLYQRAVELFEERWEGLRAVWQAGGMAEPRFVAAGDGHSFLLKEAHVQGQTRKPERNGDSEGEARRRAGAAVAINDDDGAVKTDQGGKVPESNGGVPKWIAEYDNFNDAITSNDIPLCRPSRLASTADFVATTSAQRTATRGAVLDIYQSTTMQTVRQLCVASSECHGFSYHAANQTGTTFTTTDASTKTLQWLPDEAVYLRTGQWQDDPLDGPLRRFKATQRLQVAGSRDTQFDAYGPSNAAPRCRIHVAPTDTDEAGTEGYEVYEPVSGISRYEILDKLDHVGPWRGMQACTRHPHCNAMSLVIRDGHAYLLHIEGLGRKADTANLRMREPPGNGGDGTFRLYIRVAQASEAAAPVIEDKEVVLSDYAFVPLRDTKLASLPVPPAPSSVVVSLTTIPSRVDQTRDTLLSLLQQTRPPDAILLALPTVSDREGGKPYVIPRWLLDLRPVVQILDTPHDYGPATKLIPALQHLKAQGGNHLILVVDDDTHYPPRLLETLLRWHEVLPQSALSFRGWAVHEAVTYLPFSHSYIVFGNDLMAPHPVSVLTANCGYMVQTAFFEDPAQLGNYTNVPDGARWMDDVWISGQLARAGVPRLVVPFDEHQYTYNSYLPALTLDNIRLRTSAKYTQKVPPKSAREAANNQALTYFLEDWDVLWQGGYRIFSESLGIHSVKPRITTRAKGLYMLPAPRSGAYEGQQTMSA